MRRALIVGIDDYPSQPLQGCVNDANRMGTILARNEDGSPNFDCRLMTAPETTVSRPLLRQSIKELFEHPADVAWFHFSGHGFLNNHDGYLVTQDANTFDEGVPMSEVLDRADQSPVSDILMTLDCCYSGATGSTTPGNRVHLREGVSVVTATRAAQPSLEVSGGGVFTSLLVEALDGGAAGVLGEITVAGIYAYIDSALGAWDQRPLFRANVSQLIRLRDARARVPLSLMHDLPSLFPVTAEDFPLDPSYEPTAEPAHEEHERIFRDLQRLRAYGLVEPIGEEHMYFAAVNSAGCRLTKLGLYYWRLVNDNRI